MGSTWAASPGAASWSVSDVQYDNTIVTGTTSSSDGTAWKTTSFTVSGIGSAAAELLTSTGAEVHFDLTYPSGTAPNALQPDSLLQPEPSPISPIRNLGNDDPHHCGDDDPDCVQPE